MYGKKFFQVHPLIELFQASIERFISLTNVPRHTSVFYRRYLQKRRVQQTQKNCPSSRSFRNFIVSLTQHSKKLLKSFKLAHLVVIWFCLLTWKNPSSNAFTSNKCLVLPTEFISSLTVQNLALERLQQRGWHISCRLEKSAHLTPFH